MPVDPTSPNCVRDEMQRWREGQLHSGSGQVVPNTPQGRKQALAISVKSCGKNDFYESLTSLGFSQDSSKKVGDMLLTLPNWQDQFLRGNTSSKLPRENKTTIAPSLPGLDVDNRPGKQEGDQGKHKKESALSIFPVSIPKGNPQQGPRSRSDLTGLAMFEEKNSLVGQCNQKEKREQRRQQRTQEERQADQKRAAQMAGRTVAPNANRQAAAQKAAETRKRCRTGTNKPRGTVPTTNPSGAGVGVTTGAGGGAGSGAGPGAKG